MIDEMSSKCRVFGPGIFYWANGLIMDVFAMPLAQVLLMAIGGKPVRFCQQSGSAFVMNWCRGCTNFDALH